MVSIWDAHSGELLAVLKGHTDCVRTVDTSRDGKWIASGSYDGTMRIWETARYIDMEKNSSEFVKNEVIHGGHFSIISIRQICLRKKSLFIAFSTIKGYAFLFRSLCG
jgi:WD40 repeat protein